MRRGGRLRRNPVGRLDMTLSFAIVRFTQACLHSPLVCL